MIQAINSYHLIQLKNWMQHADFSPSTLPWSEPYRRSRSPPALVETFPPIWQLPLAPKSSGIIYLEETKSLFRL